MRSVLITGASSGIGWTTALLLDQRGFRVFATVRKQVDADRLAAAASSHLMPLLLDVTDQATISSAVTQLTQALNGEGLDILVNNAGMAAAAPLEFIPLDQFRYQLEVNVVGVLALTQACLPLLRKAQGRIINVSSIGGRVAGQMTGPYHASKFALEGLTDSLRQELAPWNIQVISVQPTAIKTPIWDTSMQRADEMLDQSSTEIEQFYGSVMQKTRKMAAYNAKNGEPVEDVAEVILQSITDQQPKTRYPVGRKAWMLVKVVAKLPDRLRDWLIARAG